MFSRSALQYPYIPTVLLYFNQLNFAILKYTMSVYNHFTSPPLQLIRSHSTIQNNQISRPKTMQYHNTNISNKSHNYY